MKSKSITLLIWAAYLFTERVLDKEISGVCRCSTFSLQWTSNRVLLQAEIPYMATMKNRQRCPIRDGMTTAKAPLITLPLSPIFFFSESKKLSRNVSSTILILPFGIYLWRWCYERYWNKLRSASLQMYCSSKYGKLQGVPMQQRRQRLVPWLNTTPVCMC